MCRFPRILFWSAASLLALALIGFGLPGLVQEIHGTPARGGATFAPRWVQRSQAVADGDLLRVKARGVIQQRGMDSPAVVLTTEDEKRFLPIFIGHNEAAAILRNLNDIELPRPMTHDLLLAVMQHLGGKVNRVVVTRLDQGTFYADLVISLPDDKTAVLDARPSDSIALAVKSGAEIFVAREVFDEAGHSTEDPAEEDKPETAPPAAPEQPKFPI